MPDQTTATKFTATPSLIAPYDVVTVISQRSLNAHLKRAYDATSLLQSASFRPPAEEEDDYSGFDVAFDAPKVELQLATENKIVVLVLNIKSGDLKYLKISGRKVTELEFTVPPVTIALEVNLVSESVPFTSLPGDIQATFASGKDLEIRKTLLDFKTASLARLRKTQTTLYSVVEDISQSALIAGYIDEYLQRLAEKQDDFVFHYVASVPSAAMAKETYVLPSIVPTGASAVQNLPANGLHETVGTSIGEDSFLAYLHMSEGTILPRALLSEPAKAIIDVEGALDTPVVVISRAKFLEAVILTRFAEVNKKSTWIADTAFVEATLVPPSVKYALTGHLGWTNATPEQIAPTRVDASAVSKDVLMKVHGPGAWYHYRNFNEKEATSKGVFKVAQKATTENWVFVPEGLDSQSKATISIFGTTLVDFHTKLDINGSSGYVKSEWATTITFDSSKPDQPIVCTTEDLARPEITDEVTEEATLHKGELEDDVIKPARLLLDDFTFSLQEVAQRTTGAFRNEWPFFMPTQFGSLFVYKARFNKGLDLVCELRQ